MTDNLANVSEQAKMAGRLGFSDSDFALLRSSHPELANDYHEMSARNLYGATLMTEPSTDDGAWLGYLRETAEALGQHAMISLRAPMAITMRPTLPGGFNDDCRFD